MAGDKTFGSKGGSDPLESFQFGSVNPFELLREFDLKQLGEQRLSNEDRSIWRSLIEMLRNKNDEPWVAESLAKMAIERSRGAALALEGTTNQPVRRKIMQAMEDFMQQREKKNAVCPTVPRALAGTSDPEEIDLLCRGARWVAPPAAGLAEDFPAVCMEALLYSNNDPAHEALLSLLVTVQPRQFRQVVVKQIAENPGEQFPKKCREICELPRGKAVYHIARRLQNKGPLSSSLVARFGRWRKPYREAIVNLWAIATQSPESVPDPYN